MATKRVAYDKISWKKNIRKICCKSTVKDVCFSERHGEGYLFLREGCEHSRIMNFDGLLLATVPLEMDVTMDPTPVLHFVLHDAEEDVITTMEPDLNSTGNITHFNQRDENLAKIEVAIQALIFVFAFFGNGFVLLALKYRRRKTSRMHVFITHLSIADMLVALLNILPQMIWDITFRFQGSDASCRLVKYFQVMVLYLSTYVLVATAIDRYRAICRPLSSYSWTTRKSHILIAIAWIISAVLSLPQLIIFKMQEVSPGSGVKDCWAKFQPEWTVRLYITAFSVTVFFLPSLILGILYGRICYVVWQNVYHRTADMPEQCRAQPKSSSYPGLWPEIQNGRVRYKFTCSGNGQMMVIPQRGRPRNSPSYIRGRSHSVTGISRAKMKTIKLTFVVIIAYMLCWSPFITTQMWWAYDEDAPYNSSTFVICLLLASLNSCCNPWIYMAFSESLVQQIMPCCRRDRKNRRKPPEYYHRERIQFAPPPFPKAEPADSDEDEKVLQEDIPLQIRLRNEDLRRKSTLLSRTTSTKLSTLYRTDSKSSKYGNVILRYSKEHGIIAAANIANWPCAGTAYKPEQGCAANSNAQARADTKVCECKKCLYAMSEKSQKKNFLASWKEKDADRDRESSKSSSSSSKKRQSKDYVRDSVTGKKLKLYSDNSHPFLSYKSIAEQSGQDQADHEAKYTSV